jgi:hypothetical protein
MSRDTVFAMALREAKANQKVICPHCGTDVGNSAAKSRHSLECSGVSVRVSVPTAGAPRDQDLQVSFIID